MDWPRRYNRLSPRHANGRAKRSTTDTSNTPRETRFREASVGWLLHKGTLSETYMLVSGSRVTTQRSLYLLFLSTESDQRKAELADFTLQFNRTPIPKSRDFPGTNTQGSV